MALDKLNRRDSFRVTADQPCRISTTEVAGRAVRLGPVHGRVRDLSAGGCWVITDLDLPIRLSPKLLLEFTLRGEPFRIEAWPVRKLDDRKSYQYGLQFTPLHPQDEARLVRMLMVLETDKRP